MVIDISAALISSRSVWCIALPRDSVEEASCSMDVWFYNGGPEEGWLVGNNNFGMIYMWLCCQIFLVLFWIVAVGVALIIVFSQSTTSRFLSVLKVER